MKKIRGPVVGRIRSSRRRASRIAANRQIEHWREHDKYPPDFDRKLATKAVERRRKRRQIEGASRRANRR